VAPSVQWHVSGFDGLSINDLYDLIAARVEVFIVEQNCPYQDVDGKDRHALHVWARDEANHVVAYARITHPGVRFQEPSIGRVITTQAGRSKGLGRELMTRAIAVIEARYPQQAIRISAQQYLERFYQSLGFKTVSEPYLEDNIPHLEMLRSAKQ